MEVYSDNIDKQLEAAYRAAVYEVPQFGIQMKIGQYNHAIAEFMIDNNVSCWAFISPENPGSRLLPESENAERHRKMQALLRADGWRFCTGWGKDEAGKWPPEKSYLILNMDEAAGRKLAEAFGQKAIVTGDLKVTPKLVICC